jgi:hypothetical protein
VYAPSGVDAEVVTVSVREQLGEQGEVGEKDAVAPPGSPEAEKETACEVPPERVAVMMLETESPWATDLLPSFEREKLKAELPEPIS